MTNTTQISTRKGIMFAAITATLWGFLAIALKVAVGYIDPIAVAWFRFLFAFVFLFGILFFSNKEKTKLILRPPLLAIIAGIGLGFNYVGYIKGLQLTTPNSAQVVIQIAPIILAIIGLIFFKERLSKVQALGFLLALSGFVLFYYDKLSSFFNETRDTFNFGILLVVLGALSWVIYAALQKVLVKKYNPQSLNLIVFLVPGILLIPFVPMDAFMNLSLPMWGLLAFLGVNTLVAYGSLAEAFRHLEANKVGIIITLNPMITIAAMYLLSILEVSWIAPEKISVFGLMGAVMVVTGAIFAVRSKKTS